MEEILKKISQQWFLREPAYFALYCLQHTVENRKMQCLMRVGQGRLEYNPDLLQDKTLHEVEQLMRIEMIRLFLKHPYERQPDGVRQASLALGSDVTICDNYNKTGAHEKFPLRSPKELKLEEGMHYEWYVKRIDEMLDNNKLESDEQNYDKASLWQEDDVRIHEINELIKSQNQWGSIPGNMVEMIEASTLARIDYRQIFQGFRGSILSSKRKLSRMRPNRRMGFQQMGSVREFNTRLLVAVDVSGSITDETLSNFYSVINRMFKYGIEQIDCVQFDCEMGPVQNIHKARRIVEVTGRGGTSFQPVFDYLEQHSEYDGLIILTDGEAAIPKVADSIEADVLWVCQSEECYEIHHHWMELLGRVCWMIL